MRLIRSLAFGAMLLVESLAQAEPGILAGQVKDPTGAVLDHVQIAVQHMERIAGDLNERSQLKADMIIVSDYDGSFHASLPPGDYVVLIVWEAFEPAVRKVRIEGGKQSTLRVQLKASSLDKWVH